MFHADRAVSTNDTNYPRVAVTDLRIDRVGYAPVEAFLSAAR